MTAQNLAARATVVRNHRVSAAQLATSTIRDLEEVTLYARFRSAQGAKRMA
jgi:hypothetical protein